MGLFIGVEFVMDRSTREPATALASLVCSRLKDDHSILSSLDGAHDNVMVIKPPLCFSYENAKTFADALSSVLGGITKDDIANATHTPT